MATNIKTTSPTPKIHCIFHQDTNTCTYIVKDGNSQHAMIVDPVLDYDAASATTSTKHNDAIIAYCKEQNLQIDYIIETHVHADHLTGADHLKSRAFPTAKTAIGKHVTKVQELFQQVFHLVDAEKDHFYADGRQFDVLLQDGQEFTVGNDLTVKVLHTPGHTPACICLVVGCAGSDPTYAVFTGDTLFMPDMGTARCDFPGGSVEQLYHSIQRLYAHCSDHTKVFVGHDYGPNGRDIAWETTIGIQKSSNKQLSAETTLETFAAFRTQRDAQLGAPKLLIPSLQINLRNGKLPPPEDNGTVYLKVPMNVIGKK